MVNTSPYMRESNRLRVTIRQGIPDGFFLVVDDDDEICALISLILEKNGFRAVNANTVSDAQTILFENGEKVICAIIDLNLNGEDGEEVIRDLERNYPRIPYVVCTGAPDRAKRAIDHFPRANVIHKGANIEGLLTAMGVDKKGA
jgi:DNA-binding NtrC family response regulator